MRTIKIKFKWDPEDKETKKTKLPAYTNPGDAGLDLRSTIDFTLQPGEVVKIPVGWAIELPPGYEGQIRPRSGLAWKHGVTVVNAPGTIDEGYRDEIKVLLINFGKSVFYGRAGDRVAQLVIVPVPRIIPVEVSSLTMTTRGKRGIGSTGI